MKWNILLVVSLTFLVISAADESTSVSSEVQTECVRHHLRLTDSEAYVGFLFTYKIPDEAFTGEISEYRVSEACEDTLPAWLTFDPNNQTFMGLPQSADAGLAHICVRAVGFKSANDERVCSAKDVFSIDVKIGLPPSFSCPEEESVVLGNVLADATLSDLHQTEIFNILHSLGTALQITEDSIRLTSLIKRYDSKKNPALFSGSADNTEQTNQGLRFQFQIGCSGEEITSEHRFVNFLQENYATGELSRLVRNPVIAWEVRRGFYDRGRLCQAGGDSCRLTMEDPSGTASVLEPLDTSGKGPQPSDTSDTGTVNQQPLTDNSWIKLAAVTGKVWGYQIPEDTFVDPEDGGTRNLHLTFANDRQDVLPWIHFDSETQTISALPLDDHVGKYRFSLDAMDSNGSTATKRVVLFVKRHLKFRRLNHEFVTTLTYNNTPQTPDVIWQTEFLNDLSRALGHDDTAFIVVKSISLNPITIGWVNEDMLRETCPITEINQFYNTMASEDGTPNAAIKNSVLPKFQIQKIELKFDGTCVPVDTQPEHLLNFRPILRNSINNVLVTVGEVFRLKIPEDTFYDVEDGSTRNLVLSLHELDTSELSESSWIYFDSLNQEIYAIAGKENIGRNMYTLKATDSGGLSAEDTFALLVETVDEWRNSPAKFSISLDESFSEFNSNIRRKLSFAEKLLQLNGDDSSRHLMILFITEGSVVLTWTNKTLFKELCPVDEIRELSKLLVDDDCQPTTKLVKAMQPEFRVTKVDITLASACVPTDFTESTEKSSVASVIPQVVNCAEYEFRVVPGLIHGGDAFSTDSGVTDTGTIDTTVEIPLGESNNQPIIKNRINKFRVTAGKIWIYEIPEDIFEDLEDGNTRNLKLEFLTLEHTAVNSDSWIHFDSETQVLSAFPLADDVNRYEYVLKAVDSKGSAVEELVSVSVAHQHRLMRRFTHEFIVTMKYNKRHHPVKVDWQIKFVKKLARIMGHNDVNLITLKSVDSDPVKVTWVDDNLINPFCPFDDISQIYSTLATENGAPRKTVTDVMLPEFRIEKIELRFSVILRSVCSSLKTQT